MDARHLETLRVVHERGGVARAAAVLHCTPSAVSQQLASLQREAGVALTERVGRGLRLTPAGRELADAALDVATALERARSVCAEYQSRPVGVVRVAAFQSAAQMLLPGLLSRVPDAITVEAREEDVAQHEFPGLTAEADIVVAHRPDGSAWPASVMVTPLLREPLDVAVPLGHRLADRASVGPKDLAGERWIAVREGFPVAAVLTEIGRRAGEQPMVVHRINDFHVIEALVTAGHGIALLPRLTADDRGGSRFRLVPLEGVPGDRLVDALMRRDRAERFVVRQVLAALVAEAAAVAASR